MEVVLSLERILILKNSTFLLDAQYYIANVPFALNVVVLTEQSQIQ